MKKNYLYNLLLSLVNILFPILSFPYASRILGPEGIGKVQMVSSFAQYFALLAAFGIPYYGIREIARYRDNKQKMSLVFSELFTIYCITSLLSTAVYIIIIFNIAFFQINLLLYLYAGLLVLLGFSSIDWLYTGLEEFKIISLRSVFIKIVSLICLYTFVKDVQDFHIYLFILIFSILGNNFINLLLIRKHTNFVFKNLTLKKYIKPLFFIFGTNVATSMYMVLDTVILGFLSDEHAVGLYTAAMKLTKITIPFVTSLAAIFIPKLSKHFFEDNISEIKPLLHQSFHFIAFFSVPISMGLLLLAPEFITVFSGSQFNDAVTSMQLLAFLPLIIGFGYFFALQILVPVGKNKEMFIAVIAGMIIGLALNIILVPSLKSEGASIANIVCELVVTGLYFYFIQKTFSFDYPWLLLIKSFASSLVFAPLIYVIHMAHFSSLITLLTSIAGCTSIYIGIQYFIFKDHFVLQIKDQFIAVLKRGRTV